MRKMRKQAEGIDWTDIFFIPTALVMTYILALWLRAAIAAAVSFVLVSLVFLVFKPRKGSLKVLVVGILCGAIIVYILGALFNWPP